MAIFACVFASQIIEVLYGAKYTGAVIYFQIILAINLIRVVPYAPIMMGFDMGCKYAFANFVPAVLTIILDLIWVTYFRIPLGIAIVQCVCTIVCVIMMLFYISKRISIKVTKLIPYRESIKIIFASVCSSVLIYLIRNIIFLGTVILQLCIEGILFLMIYIIICHYLKIEYSGLINSLFHRRTT